MSHNSVSKRVGEGAILSARSVVLRARSVVLSAAKDLLFLLVLSSPIAAQASDKAVERELFRIEDDFARAVVKRDARALGRIVAPKWVYSDESGVMDRAAGIKAFISGTDTVTEASNSNMRAMVYGDAAVVIGILHMKGRGPAGPFNRHYRYTDTWVKLDGRWQCVAAQDYLMPESRKK